MVLQTFLFLAHCFCSLQRTGRLKGFLADEWKWSRFSSLDWRKGVCSCDGGTRLRHVLRKFRCKASARQRLGNTAGGGGGGFLSLFRSPRSYPWAWSWWKEIFPISFLRTMIQFLLSVLARTSLRPIGESTSLAESPLPLPAACPSPVTGLHNLGCAVYSAHSGWAENWVPGCLL